MFDDEKHESASTIANHPTKKCRKLSKKVQPDINLVPTIAWMDENNFYFWVLSIIRAFVLQYGWVANLVIIFYPNKSNIARNQNNEV